MVGRNSTITHVGKVVEVNDDKITVLIPRASACGSCHAKGFCSSTDSKETVMTIPNKGENVVANEEVTVSIQRSVGFQAVLFAFVFPIFLMLVVIFSLPSILGLSEELSGLIGLGSLIPYFFLIYLFNHKFTKKFIFHIEKLQ